MKNNAHYRPLLVISLVLIGLTKFNGVDAISEASSTWNSWSVTNIARTKIKICQYESASFVTTASPGEFQILESQLGYARYTAMNASFYSDVVGIGCVGQTIHYYYASEQAKTVTHFKYDTSTDVMSEMETTSSFVSIRIADNLDNFLAYITYGDVHTYSAKLRDAFDSEVIDILNADRNSWYIPAESVTNPPIYSAILDNGTNTISISQVNGELMVELPLPKVFNDPELFYVATNQASRYYVTSLTDGEFRINNLNIGSLDIPNVISRASTIIQTSNGRSWNGAILSALLKNNGSVLLVAYIEDKIIDQYNMDTYTYFTSDAKITVQQLSNSTFQLSAVNAVELFSQLFFFTETNVIVPVGATPVPPPLLSVNESIVVEQLILNDNITLVMSNEAVITVTNCASLDGALKYVLSQPQYQKLIENNTLNVLVLLTECTNGSFDSIEVTALNQDDCITFTATPNQSPAQLTLLVTTQQSIDCDQVIGEPDVLGTGAIIGIVVGCAGAVVLIIVLALYFSPMREKVFPYAKGYNN